MSFKLTNEQMKMLIEKQTAPPSTGDLYMWGFVDRKEKKAARKQDKASSLRERANELESRGRFRRAERLRKRAARKEGKADKKLDQAKRKKMRPDYWMRRGEDV